MTERAHGWSRYASDGCRCFTCRLDYSQHRVQAQGHGGPGGSYVPAAAVIEHIHALSAKGLGTRRLAGMVGVEERTIRNWKQGRVRFARRETVAAVLAVELDEARPYWVDPTGSHRRAKALVALGWPLGGLADRLGLSASNWFRSRHGKQFDPKSAEKITALYNELSMVIPEDSTASRRARNRAVRDCWFKPLAWDDERLDDPDALPCLLPPVGPVARDLELLVQHLVAGHPVEPTVDAIREVIRRMPDAKTAEIARLAQTTPGRVSNLKGYLLKGASC